MNVFTFSGNLGNDAEQRHTAGGTAVLQFSVAVTSGYGDKKQTTWVRCSLFGKRGESLAPYMNKGQQVVVSGEACLREWDAKDGTKQKSLEVNVNDVTLVGGKDSSASSGQKAVSQQGAGQTEPDSFDDDIPF